MEYWLPDFPANLEPTANLPISFCADAGVGLSSGIELYARLDATTGRELGNRIPRRRIALKAI